MVIIGDKRNNLANSRKGSDIVWHKDVQIFSVWNDDEQGSGFLGYLYLDPFPREGKYTQLANFNLQLVSMIFKNFRGLDLAPYRALSKRTAYVDILLRRWYATLLSLLPRNPVF